VIVTGSQLNVVRLPVFAAAVRVRVAWIDCPSGRTVLCRFHVRVKEELALDGFQLAEAIVSVSGTLPVFFDVDCLVCCVAWVEGSNV